MIWWTSLAAWEFEFPIEPPIATCQSGSPAGRKHALSTEQLPVSAYVGSSKNLKDLEGGKGDYAALVSGEKGTPPSLQSQTLEPLA